MNGRFEESDGERVRSALASADFTGKLNTLEDGIKTHLTREFNDDGTNLSGAKRRKLQFPEFCKGFSDRYYG